MIDHGNDPFNTFNVTLQLVWDFVQLYGFIENEKWAEMVPARIPVYLIAGDRDPCGNYGEGLYHAANLLANSGNVGCISSILGFIGMLFLGYKNFPEVVEQAESVPVG